MASADLAGEHRPSIFAALAARLVAERERWPLWFPVLMGVGIAIYFSLAREPAWWIGAAGFGGAGKTGDTPNDAGELARAASVGVVAGALAVHRFGYAARRWIKCTRDVDGATGPFGAGRS